MRITKAVIGLLRTNQNALHAERKSNYAVCKKTCSSDLHYVTLEHLMNIFNTILNTHLQLLEEIYPSFFPHIFTELKWSLYPVAF